MKKYFKDDANKGYTLVELLTVVVVMIVIGLIITSIIVSSLRGGSKTSAINEIRDNGNTALTRMARAIEFAKSFEGISETGQEGTFLADCLLPVVGEGTPTPAPTRYKFLKVRAFDEGETVFSCADSKIASSSVSLIDDTAITSVDADCYFTCSQAYLTQPPTIGINFKLVKGVNSVFFEQKSTTDFHTSVVMRNLSL